MVVLCADVLRYCFGDAIPTVTSFKYLEDQVAQWFVASPRHSTAPAHLTNNPVQARQQTPFLHPRLLPRPLLPHRDLPRNLVRRRRTRHRSPALPPRSHPAALARPAHPASGPRARHGATRHGRRDPAACARPLRHQPEQSQLLAVVHVRGHGVHDGGGQVHGAPGAGGAAGCAGSV